MPAEELYNLCSNVDIKTSTLLFTFMKQYNYVNRMDEFNDVIIDTYKIACSNNNINAIKNIITCTYNGTIDLDVFWLCINTTKIALYYLIKQYIGRPERVYSAFMDGVMCPCYFSSDSCSTIMSKTIISYGYYEEAR
jgi:hypothetical protein